MSFFKLTSEILKAIAVALDEAEEQRALNNLAQVDRSFHALCNPLLYRQPLLVDFGALGSWKLAVAGRGKDGHQHGQLLKIEKLFVQGVGRARSSCATCKQKGHATDEHDQSFASLFDEVPLSYFYDLHTLSIFNSEVPADVLARLLGPLAPLRQTIRDLTLVKCGMEQKQIYAFLLLHLYFITTSTVTRLADKSPKADKAQLAPSDPTRQAAVTDWGLFEKLHIDPTGIPATQGLAFGQPPTPHSFSALTRLHLRILAIKDLKGDDLILIFLTNLFPNLKTLQLEGNPSGWVWQEAEHLGVMRSVYEHRSRPDAVFKPPKLTGIPPSTPPARLWRMLSAVEVASVAFTAYRGPSLVVLDMSELTLPLVPK